MPRELSPDVLLKQHPSAHELSVYDGATRIGSIIAADDNWRTAKSWAFDADDRPLGEFRRRREAMAAVGASRRRDAP